MAAAEIALIHGPPGTGKTEVIVALYQRRETLGGLQIIDQPPFLRHFSARFAPIEASAAEPTGANS